MHFARSRRRLLLRSMLLVLLSPLLVAEAHEDGFEFTALDANGSKQKLTVGRGTVTIVAFWATWCAPCRTSELPGLNRLLQDYPSTRLRIHAVNNDGDHEFAVRFLNHPDVRFGEIENSVAYDPSYRAYREILGHDYAEVHPAAALFDKNGNQLRTFYGKHDWISPEFRSLLDAHI